jgi:CTP:molybdopterin cytidylyltransferase MocA
VPNTGPYDAQVNTDAVSALFAELARLEGAAGAKQVIKRHAAEAYLLPFRGGEVDVDTPGDFSRLIAGRVEREQD